MRKFTSLFLISALAVSAFISGCGGSSSDDGTNEVLIAVNDAGTSLHLLPTDSWSLGSALPVTGLQTGETIEAIDVRPADGVLYAFTNEYRLYTIDTDTGVATQVGVQLVMTGSVADIDFNPTVDRLRVVTSTGENVRLNPDTGLIAGTDTNLFYAIGDTNEGNSISIGGIAYTNNTASASTTVLYGLDADQDTLVNFPSPNNGAASTVASTASIGGSMGLDVSGNTEFVYALNSGTEVYRVNTVTGELISQVNLGVALNDIAVLP
ncbi:MAG: DUF4394 domain-containing protein [Fimbriimonadaceae bacterium]|nr:MAG: DUF4394 domain-containing protein [Fimbriimonadaceae bacterium]